MKPNLLIAAALFSLSLGANAFGQSTKDIVNSAMTQLMVEKDISAIDRYFAEPYIQHNQTVPSGLDGLKGLASQAIANNPKFKYKMVRSFADGDIGVAHGVYEGFGEAPLVGFDVFRVANGKIVEHWDNLSPLAEKNPSGRTQTDGATDIKDVGQTRENKALVKSFMNDVLIGGAFDKMPMYFDGDNYLQHNSNIADGLSGLGAGLKAMAEAGITMRITKLHHLYGEGNFVLAISQGTLAAKPVAFYDLFRVENKKIAEHWDVISPILPNDKAANSNGKF